jgi:hypothetical protein
MRFTIFIALVLSLTFFTGCSQPNPFGTVYVEGVVTLDGQPLAGADVMLHPRNGVHVAGGLTDARGRFTVTTGGAPLGSGAQPGEYDVTFRKVRMEGADLSMEELAARFGGRMPPAEWLIPQKYGEVRTSGLDPITVTPNRRQNVFTFELTSE